MSASVDAFRAKLSANRKSLRLSMCTLVFALRRCRLKTPPSLRYLMSMPGSFSEKASVSKAVNIKPNWSQNTALLDTICDLKESGLVAIIKNVGLHAP